MSDKIKIELARPKGKALSEEVHMVVVPAYDGAMAILPHRAPIITKLKSGVVEVYKTSDNKPTETYYVRAGWMNTANDKCRVMSEEIYSPKDEINKEEIAKKIAKIEEEIPTAVSDDAKYAKLEDELDFYKGLVKFFS